MNHRLFTKRLLRLGGKALRRVRIPLSVVIGLIGLCAYANENKSIPITDPLRQLTNEQYGNLDPTEATVSYAQSGALVQQLFPSLRDKEYCIIHIVRWNPAAGTSKYSVDKQHWYVYQNKIVKSASTTTFRNNLSSSDYAGTRIYGESKIGFLYIYLNTQGDTVRLGVTYKLDITPKTPDNIQNLTALLKFVAGLAAPPSPDAYYVAKELDISYKTSDLKFTAYVTPETPVGGAAPTTPTQLTEMTFDNEGRYYWDVDFAVPLKSYKDVKLDQSGDTIQPKTITRQNVFATVELYPWKVDTKKAQKVFVPSLVAGIPISGKPLDRYLVALGLGTNWFRGFVGVGFDRRTASLTGEPLSTPAPTDQWIRKLSFGITVPLRPVLQNWKGSSSKTQ
jgi:hypothetical protein